MQTMMLCKIFPGLLTAPGISLYADRFVVQQGTIGGVRFKLDDVIGSFIRSKARPLAIELREPFLGRAVVDLHFQAHVCIVRRAADQDAAVTPVCGIGAVDHRAGTRIRADGLGVDQMCIFLIKIIKLALHQVSGTALVFLERNPVAGCPVHQRFPYIFRNVI